MPLEGMSRSNQGGVRPRTLTPRNREVPGRITLATVSARIDPKGARRKHSCCRLRPRGRVAHLEFLDLQQVGLLPVR